MASKHTSNLRPAAPVNRFILSTQAVNEHIFSLSSTNRHQSTNCKIKNHFPSYHVLLTGIAAIVLFSFFIQNESTQKYDSDLSLSSMNRLIPVVMIRLIGSTLAHAPATGEALIKTPHRPGIPCFTN